MEQKPQKIANVVKNLLRIDRHNQYIVYCKNELPAEFDPETGRVTAPVTSTIEMTVSEGDLDIFLSEQLYGAQEVTLVSDGENPVEIWSTDYVKVRGIASFQVEVK